MRLRRGTVVIATLAVLALAGCGGDDEGAVVEGNKITVPLEEQSDSGQSGTATLTAVDDERTRVVIELDGAPAGPQPAHIHENACDRIDPTPTDALKDVRSGRSETVVGVSFNHLRDSPHAINVHRSADALDKYVACGTIGEQRGGGGGGAGY
jgi:hypothetical protein